MNRYSQLPANRKSFERIQNGTRSTNSDSVVVVYTFAYRGDSKSEKKRINMATKLRIIASEANALNTHAYTCATQLRSYTGENVFYGDGRAIKRARFRKFCRRIARKTCELSTKIAIAGHHKLLYSPRGRNGNKRRVIGGR